MPLSLTWPLAWPRFHFDYSQLLLIVHDYEPAVALGAAAVRPGAQSPCPGCGPPPAVLTHLTLFPRCPSTFKLHSCGDHRVQKRFSFSLIQTLLVLWFCIPPIKCFLEINNKENPILSYCHALWGL